jgi:hypothetical protein
MRTTIRLDDQLLSDAKALAARTGRTLTGVIEDALRAALAQRADGPSGEDVKLPTFDGDGLQPGVDLDDSAALLDVMESGRDPR